MSRRYAWPAWTFHLVCGGCLCAALGCTGQRAQLTQCQTEKEKLLARIQEEKTRAENLEVDRRLLTQRLDEAEKSLAQSQDGRQRLAELKRSAPGGVDLAPDGRIGDGRTGAFNRSPPPLNFSATPRSARPELLNPPLTSPQNEPPSGDSGWTPRQPSRNLAPRPSTP